MVVLILFLFFTLSTPTLRFLLFPLLLTLELFITEHLGPETPQSMMIASAAAKIHGRPSISDVFVANFVKMSCFF